MRLPPFDLLQANSHVKRIDTVLVLEKHQVLIQHVGVLQLVTIEHLQRAADGLVVDRSRVAPASSG